MSSSIIVQRVCEYCSNIFQAKTTHTRYCSRQCNCRHYKVLAREKKIQTSNNEVSKVLSLPFEILNAKPFLSVPEVSKLLGVSSRTIYRLIKTKEIVIKKIGRRTIIARDEIKRYFSN